MEPQLPSSASSRDQDADIESPVRPSQPHEVDADHSDSADHPDSADEELVNILTVAEGLRHYYKLAEEAFDSGDYEKVESPGLFHLSS